MIDKQHDTEVAKLLLKGESWGFTAPGFYQNGHILECSGGIFQISNCTHVYNRGRIKVDGGYWEDDEWKDIASYCDDFQPLPSDWESAGIKPITRCQIRLIESKVGEKKDRQDQGLPSLYDLGQLDTDLAILFS